MSKETSNPFKLPRGEKIRRELVAVFRRQRKAVLRYLNTGKKDDYGVSLPAFWPSWHDFGFGAIDEARRFTPMLQACWKQGGEDLFARVGLDPDEWSVTNPHTEEKIAKAALDFCAATNQTTSLQLDEALKKTRDELIEGIVKRGESLAALTKRVNAVFDQAEKYRARRIAATEASRAVHAAGEAAAYESGVVTGWEWLASDDCCPLCRTVARRCPRVKLGQPFAIVGDHPSYSQVRFPPLHPGDQCSVVEILDTDQQPAWGETLLQPKPEAEDEPGEAEESPKPTPTPKPKPLPPKKPKPRPAEPAVEVVPEPKPGRGEPLPPKPAPKPRPDPGVVAPKPEPAKPKPTPEPPPLPTPAKPGEPIDPKKPIKDRIAAWKDGDARLEKLKAIDSSKLNDCLDEIKRCEAELRKINKKKAHTSEDSARFAELYKRAGQLRVEAEAHRGDVLASLTRTLSIPDHENEGLRIHATTPGAAGGKVAAASEFYGRACRAGSGPVEVEYAIKNARANYDLKAKRITLDPRDHVGVVAHEQAHAVETQCPEIEKRLREFLAYRCDGETPTKMNKVAPGKGYDKDEEGRKDHFDRHFDLESAYYVGKHYRAGTEILSMGVEALIKNPAGFAKDDPEYCKFVLGILSGELR